ncbi:hypothetical protein G6O67_007617 [Ophiocordyceps sinensis]|uniref:Uncharacterized protein n=2 Tax=Ophiocordyceps sinensis TaxID=72228 RepID=A0A8H4LU62_9HYPO|nr:hypothetical protein OCS_06835 [Ophiocordyceps sinensis CO18]KAF4505698.1 hypothetical protein G6O67_007617 [Ophiocordyceps sinensis]
MFSPSQQPPERPPTPRHGQTMELSDSDSDSDSDSSHPPPEEGDATPRAVRAASQEPDTIHAAASAFSLDDAARAAVSQALVSQALVSQALGSQALGGHVDPILFPAPRRGSSSSEAENMALDASSHPDHASSSPQSQPGFDDVSILNRQQLIARVHRLRRELQQALIDKHELEERRQNVLLENNRLATRLAEMQQQRDDRRTKAIDGDFWPPTAPSSARQL